MSVARRCINLVLLCVVLVWMTPVVAAVQFKLATVAPEGSMWMRELRAAASEVDERTAGRVKVKYYPGGVMGNDKKVLRKVRIGQLQGGAFTASGLSERYADIVIYGLPLLFNDDAEVDYVRERMDPQLAAGLSAAGFESLGMAGGGFAVLMGAEQVTSLDQLRGRKVWVPEGDLISYAAMESLDLSPVVLPITDVLTGLQTGLLEFVATPPVGAVILQWYTKIKYVTEIPLAYTLGILAVDQRSFRRLDEQDQIVFREVMQAAYARLDAQSRSDNESAREALLANGLKIRTPPASDVEAWRSAASVGNEKLVKEGIVSQAILDQLLQHVADFRGAAAATALSAQPSAVE